jgi:hypothetical protein
MVPVDQGGFAMPYYLLKPRLVDCRDWRRSAYVGEVQVYAETADDARRRANREYVGPLKLHPGFVTPAVPWINPNLCSVRQLAEPDPVLPRLGVEAGTRPRFIAPLIMVHRQLATQSSHQIHNHKGEHP